MDPNETMVDEELGNEAADDALPEEVVEETDESESLESLNTEDEGEAPAEEPAKANDSQGTSEPGWIKQRVNKAVEKALAEQERRLTAQFEAQMAPIREKMLTDEAKELVRQGEFKSLERAKEYLQLKQGQPVTNTDSSQNEQQSQPRNNRGQYASKDDPVTSARIDLLAHQADKIKASRGIDVIAEMNANEEIKQKVISGEMDMYDIAEQMAKPKAKHPPAPMRSPNGASGNNPNAIESMSDEQFRRMEKRIAEGARYSLK